MKRSQLLKSIVPVAFLLLSPGGASVSAAAPQIVYVSSCEKLDAIRPHIYHRFNGQGEVEYESEVVVGHTDYRIALFSTHNYQRGNVQLSIDLISDTPDSDPVTYYLEGGKDLTDALEKAYGSTGPSGKYGYIYSLDATHFQHEQGLATKELVSHDSFSHAAGQRVDRLQEIQRLAREGKVKLKWRPAGK